MRCRWYLLDLVIPDHADVVPVPDGTTRTRMGP